MTAGEIADSILRNHFQDGEIITGAILLEDGRRSFGDVRMSLANEIGTAIAHAEERGRKAERERSRKARRNQ